MVVGAAGSDSAGIGRAPGLQRRFPSGSFALYSILAPHCPGDELAFLRDRYRGEDRTDRGSDLNETCDESR